jgi:hypothetical protein
MTTNINDLSTEKQLHLYKSERDQLLRAIANAGIKTGNIPADGNLGSQSHLMLLNDMAGQLKEAIEAPSQKSDQTGITLTPDQQAALQLAMNTLSRHGNGVTAPGAMLILQDMADEGTPASDATTHNTPTTDTDFDEPDDGDEDNEDDGPALG